MRALLSAILVCAGAPAALAQSYSASGQVGYLQEWEMKASLAKTVIGKNADFYGPVTLRHVGLCSVNGVEEKSGTMRLTVVRSRVEGTLAIEGDSCRIVATERQSYSGLMTCRDGQAVPINLSVDQTSAAEQAALATGK
jgi:hypothetical protein